METARVEAGRRQDQDRSRLLQRIGATAIGGLAVGQGGVELSISLAVGIARLLATGPAIEGEHEIGGTILALSLIHISEPTRRS